MSKNHLIAALDIGTQDIKVLVVQKKGNDEKLDVISQIKENSSGVRKGVVTEPSEVSNILQILLSKVKSDIGKRISSVYININGNHLFSSLSHGLVSVSRADRQISETDVQRVLQEAKTISLPSNKEIFTAHAKEFIVDGQSGVKEVTGLQGVRLEAEVLVLGGFSPYLKNLTQAVLNSGFNISHISDMTPSPIAASRACLTDKQKEIGVALVDIGAGTTGLAVFEERGLTHLAVLPIGSENITKDIAIGLKTDIEVAERIKVEYGTCQKGREVKEKIDIGEEEPLVFSQKQLADIIEPRVSEIFKEVNKELKKISREKLLPGGIVLTGGGAKIPGIVELAKKELKLPCRVGKIQGFSGLKDDPSWATICGLVLGGSDLEGEQRSLFPDLKVGASLKKFFKNFVP